MEGRMDNKTRAEILQSEIELLRLQAEMLRLKKEQQREERRRLIAQREEEVKKLREETEQREKESRKALIEERTEEINEMKKIIQERLERERKAKVQRELVILEEQRKIWEMAEQRRMLNDCLEEKLLLQKRQMIADLKKEMQEQEYQEAKQKRLARLRKELKLVEMRREMRGLNNRAKEYHEEAEKEKDAQREIRALEAKIKEYEDIQKRLSMKVSKFEALDLPLDVSTIDWDEDFEPWQTVDLFDINGNVDGVSYKVNPRLSSARKVRMQVRHRPFSRGSFRFAFFAKVEIRGRVLRHVVKIPIVPLDEADVEESYLEEGSLGILAAFFAKRFNEAILVHDRSFNPIKFVTMQVAHVTVGENKNRKHCLAMVEPLLQGEFKKFNNNDGWITREMDGHESIQALSHFSFCNSASKVLLIDLQGVNVGNDYHLTDPAFHHRDDIETFGETNLGPKGISKFFSTHACGSTCRKLGLRLPSSY